MTTHSATIVTCYFKIKSKHTNDNYKTWMKNMLVNIETPMIIYTDEESYDYIENTRLNSSEKHGPHNTQIIKMRMEDFYTYKYKDIWDKQWNLDPENSYHTPELYMIWAEKTNFLRKSIESNPFDSEFFLWCDIGCFRRRPFTSDITNMSVLKNWPNKDKIATLPKDKILLTQIERFTGNNEKYKELRKDSSGLTVHKFPHTLVFVGGTMFGGYKDTLLKWWDVYYEMLENYFKFFRFAGKDQDIMANILIVRPDICYPVFAEWGDPWFYFHHYLK